MNDVINLVQSLGFPIAMCLLCFWRMTKQDENFHATLAKLKASIDAQTDTLKSVLTKLEGDS